MRVNRPALLVILVVGVAIGVHALGWSGAFTDGVIKLFAPATRFLRAWRASALTKRQIPSDCAITRTTLQSCLNNRPALLAAVAERDLLRDENAALRSLLKFATPTTTVVAAGIIGQSLATAEQTLIIDRGGRDGVTMGSAAISPEGILIGKITELRPRTSVVRLLQDHRSKIAALILNPERSRGIVEGGFGAGLKMKFIPRNERVRIGDQIITAGLEAGLPRGLLIGTVAEIENEAYQPFQQTTVAPGSDTQKLTTVGVLFVAGRNQ
ncbi:MAG: rod shape-determining protein MreC [Candidatus Magasanikbacteria bacterium]|nr:rod shape-determining protein MreC [Candidatus Magasanikbacteria bacterium]